MVFEHIDAMMEQEEVWKCEKCGQPMTAGSWPFCRSLNNPGGHSKEVTMTAKSGSAFKRWKRV